MFLVVLWLAMRIFLIFLKINFFESGFTFHFGRHGGRALEHLFEWYMEHRAQDFHSASTQEVVSPRLNSVFTFVFCPVLLCSLFKHLFTFQYNIHGLKLGVHFCFLPTTVLFTFQVVFTFCQKNTHIFEAPRPRLGGGGNMILDLRYSETKTMSRDSSRSP